MEVKTKIPFTKKDGDELFSPRKGAIIDVESEEAEQLIADGLAEEIEDSEGE